MSSFEQTPSAGQNHNHRERKRKQGVKRSGPKSRIANRRKRVNGRFVKEDGRVYDKRWISVGVSSVGVPNGSVGDVQNINGLFDMVDKIDNVSNDSIPHDGIDSIIITILDNP